jgi:hypothetical protein
VPQPGDLTVHVGDSLDQIPNPWAAGQRPLHLSDRQLGDLTRRLEQELAAHRAAIVSRVVSTTALLLQLIGGAILTVLLTFFLKDGPWMEAWLLKRIGDPGGCGRRPSRLGDEERVHPRGGGRRAVRCRVHRHRPARARRPPGPVAGPPTFSIFATFPAPTSAPA